MTLSDLYGQMKDDWARGSSLDGRIPGWVKRAVALIEQEHTFQWMRRSGTYTLAAGTGCNFFPFPNAQAKSLDYVRVVSYGALTGALNVPRKPLRGVDAKDVTSIGYGMPSAFFLDGLTSIYLDTFPAADIVFLVGWREFTDLSAAQPNSTPTILARSYELVQAKAMALAAQGLRDLRMFQMYAAQAQEAMQAAVAADNQMEWQHQDDMRMEFTPMGGDPYEYFPE